MKVEALQNVILRFLALLLVGLLIGTWLVSCSLFNLLRQTVCRPVLCSVKNIRAIMK
jgi:hypothetical protein